jgi:hypothetical protein
MLRYWGVVLVATVLVSLNGDPEPHETKQTQTYQQPSTPVANTQIEKSDTPTPQSKPEKHIQSDVWIVGPQAKDSFDKAAFYISVILTLVAIAGVFIGICTLSNLRKQTNHIVTSERAWLIAKSMMDDYQFSPTNEAIFQWKITNTGKTPARIVETSCSYEIVETKVLDQLPAVLDYPTPIELKGMLLGPGDYLARSVYLIAPPKTFRIERLDQGHINDIRLKLHTLRAYGYVKYLDAFDQERESRFCEYYVWPYETVQHTGFQPMLDAPAEYTKCT